MITNIQIDSKKDTSVDILETIGFLLVKNNVEVKKSVSVSEARKKLRILAKLGKVKLNYANLFTPRAVGKGEESQYSASILINKSDSITMNKIKIL